jgi:UDP-N-acetylmuramoyl-L-alanyl-D-glutamate--2,6-diaminopimelate ligase
MQQAMDCGGGVSLRQVLPRGKFLGSSDIRVRSCCSDSRIVRPGDLFVALVGGNSDGHEFAQQAVAQGATAVLAERLLPVPVPTCLVPDSRMALGHICQHLAGQPTRQMNVVGVSGSHGKTTTSVLISSVLKAAQQRVGTTNTVAYDDSFESSAARRTTPTAPELASWMARMVANGCQSAVIEVSSGALAARHLAGVELDAAVLTNIRRGQSGKHGSLLNYRRAKERLFEHLKPDGLAVLNADDPASQYLLSRVEQPMITIGMRAEAELTATLVERFPGEQTFLLHAGNETIPVRTRIIGDQHIYNCLAATAIGLVMGIDLPTIVRGLEQVAHVAGHLERVECGQPFGVYVDCAQTPDALAVALQTLRQVTPGRVFCVYGAKADGDRANRPLMGRVVERAADREVITCDNPEHEQPLQIAHDILDGYRRPGRPHILPDREAAIGWALSQARTGDSVLIAGKGHESFQRIGSRCLSFNDGDVARTWLRQQDGRTELPCITRC